MHIKGFSTRWALRQNQLLLSVKCLLLLLFSRWVVSDSLRPYGLQPSLSFTVSWSLLKLMSIELVTPSNHLILCHLLLLSPSIFPSIRIFSSELAFHIRWPKDWNFGFSISPSNEYSGLISFRIDLVWSQKSSPAPQSKSISSSVLSRKSLLMKGKKESEKAGLKFSFQKTKIMGSNPITSWQIDGETMETVTDFICLSPKSLQMVTAAMKLKEAWSLEEKLWQT